MTAIDMRQLIGVHGEMPAKEYHSLPGVSSSILRALWGKTPAHLKLYLEEGVDPTPAMMLGTIGHAIALKEPVPSLALYPETYPADDGKEKPWSNNARWCKAWMKEKKDHGFIPVTKEVSDNAYGAAQALLDHDIAGPVLRECQTEVTLITWDETNAIPVRCRLDIVPRGPFLADCKFAHTVDEQDWAKHAYNSGLHIQAALYLNVWNQMCGSVDPKEGFKFFVVEQKPPWDVRVFNCSTAFIRKGWEDVCSLLRIAAKCMNENMWPKSPAIEADLGVPKWAKD